MRIYNRDTKTGRIKPGHTKLTKEQRIEKFLDSICIGSFNGCWEWAGSVDEKGYGRFHLGNHKYTKAHRYSFELFHEIKKGYVIDHMCRNKGCVNPEHLRQVTPTTNTLENSVGIAAINKAKILCKRGHGLTTIKRGVSKGKRFCSECVKLRYRNARNKDSVTTKATAIL